MIHLYVQQCFGNSCALPIDNWVETFLKWPLGFHPTQSRFYYKELFECSDHWGKIERLIWLAVQARKVHSSVCREILWCIRFGGPEKIMRGANPLACKICATHIRNVCPAYSGIKAANVTFNNPAVPADGFTIQTSKHNNTAPSQAIEVCRGTTAGESVADEYSVRDRPDQFSVFPVPSHDGGPMTVEEFINRY